MRKYLGSISSAKFRSTLSLIASSLFTVIIGILISHLISRLLSPVEYGNYYYVINLVTFSCAALSFGLFYSASGLVLKTEDEIEIRKIHGCAILFLVVLSILIPFAVFFGYISNIGLVKSDIEQLLVYAIPGAGAVLLSSYFETVLPADNKLTILAKSRVVPKVLYLFFVLAVYFTYGGRGGDVNILLLLFFLANLIGYVYFIKKIRPLFRCLNNTFRSLSVETKEYGIHVYIGSLFSVGGAALSSMAIGYLGEDNKEVAFFALASSLCAPLVIFPTAIASVSFRSFSTQNRLPRRIIVVVMLVMGVASFSLCGVSSYLVNFLWGVEYRSVNNFVYSLTVAYLFYALADLVNRYLAARGMGKALRDSSFVVGFVLILSTIVFLKLFGGIGAAYARIASGVIYVILMLYFYKKLQISFN